MHITDPSFFLEQCENRWRLDGNFLIVDAVNAIHARALKRICTDVAAWGIAKARRFNREIEAVIVQGSDRVYEIPSSYASMSQDPEPASVPTNQEFAIEIETNFRALNNDSTIDLMLNNHEKGNIVIITGHQSNICRYTSNKLLPKRAIWTPRQYNGYNYLISWRETMDQYEELCSRLRSDGMVAGFNYELIRPDGARCWYETDYYLGIFNNEIVRIGISHPEAWRIIREAEPAKTN
jgi:hypothetical protein